MGKPKDDKPKEIPGPEKYSPNTNFTKDRIKSAFIGGKPSSRNEKINKNN